MTQPFNAIFEAESNSIVLVWASVARCIAIGPRALVISPGTRRLLDAKRAQKDNRNRNPCAATQKNQRENEFKSSQQQIGATERDNAERDATHAEWTP